MKRPFVVFAVLTLCLCQIGHAAAVADVADWIDSSNTDEALDFPYDEFTRWPEQARTGYWRELREIWRQFERGRQEHTKLAEADFQPAEQTPWRTAFHQVFELLALVPEAQALPAPGICWMGGWELAMVSDSRGAQYCPTGGKPCGRYGNQGFECGGLYSNACVRRFPARGLTDRCHAAAANTPPSRDQYYSTFAVIRSAERHCRYAEFDVRFTRNCRLLAVRLEEVRSKYGYFITPASRTAPSAAVAAAAEYYEAPHTNYTPVRPVRACFPPQVSRIYRDRGGYVSDYRNRASLLRQSGRGLEIHGDCASACLLLVAALPNDRVCVGPRARLGFHDAYDANTRVPDRAYSEAMVSGYPRAMQAFWHRYKNSTRNPLTMKWMTGRQLQAAFATCREAKSNVACYDRSAAAGRRYAAYGDSGARR